MKAFFKSYLNNEMKVDKSTFISILCALFVIGGIYGTIYETIFYYFNNGALCKRGSCFGPWIEIYGVGCLLIYWLTRKYKKSPLAVFFIAGLSCGLLEYLAGKGMYILFDGRRGWDYNTEILNFGNIEGFVCLRSVLVFALSGLMVIYLVYPLLLWLSNKVNKEAFMIVSITLASLFAIDVIYNDVIVSIFNTYGALDFYSNIDIFKYYNQSKIH